MLLVYTHKITPRVKYAFKQICTRILGIPVEFTSTVEVFIAHQSLKLSYTKQPLGKELFIKSTDLLFEEGITDVELTVFDWDNTKAFFKLGESSAIPSDIFAATFYMLSRYEEYLPHVKDDFGRFTAKESLAFKYDFLDQPVVDAWAYKFKVALQERFPDFIFPTRHYNVLPVIDIPAAYKFKHIGLFQGFIGSVRDFFNFKFSLVYQRFLVNLGLMRDPYATYTYILNRQKKFKKRFKMFFLVGDYTTFDNSISTQKQSFVSLIKHVSDYCDIGIKTSFSALSSSKVLKKEKCRLEHIVNTKVVATRQSFSKINLPLSYRNSVDLEITEDFTMGYTDELGFRAGTCTPFFFYDLDYEVQTPLKIYSYNILDYSLLKKFSLLDKQEAVAKIINRVKSVNGTLIPIFHNYTFSNDEEWKHFKTIFNQILDSETL